MKNHHQLLQDYEDAVWALAMERVSIQQAEYALELNARLNADPAAAVPDSVRQRCMQAIDRAFAPKLARRVGRIASRVLTAAVLCALLCTAACAISPQFKEFVLNAFYSVAEQFTSISIGQSEESAQNEEQESNNAYYGISFRWIPEGYELESGAADNALKYVTFSNASAEKLRVTITSYADTSSYNYNSEESTGTVVEINSFTAMLHEQDMDSYTKCTLTWVDEENQVVVLVSATALTADELCRFSEKLYY